MAHDEHENREGPDVNDSAFTKITDDDSVAGDYEFPQEDRTDPSVSAVTVEAEEEHEIDPPSQDDAEAPTDPEHAPGEHEDEDEDEEESLDGEHVLRVLDERYIEEVLDEPVIDEARYQRYIEVPDSRPEDVSQLGEDELERFVVDLTPSHDDLCALLDTSLNYEVAGPSTVSAVNAGEELLDLLRENLSDKIDIENYSVDSGAVREGIMRGKVPSLTQYLLDRQVARNKRESAVDTVRKTEAEQIARKREWVRQWMEYQRRKFMQDARTYDAENPPLSESVRREFFQAIENEARTLELQADDKLIPAARREMCDVILEADPDNETAKALRKFVNTKYQKERLVESSMVFDEQMFSIAPGAPAVAENTGERNPAYDMLDDTATPASAPRSEPTPAPEIAAPVEEDDPATASEDEGIAPAVEETDKAPTEQTGSTDDEDDRQETASEEDEHPEETDDEDDGDEEDDNPLSGVVVVSGRKSKKSATKPAAKKSVADKPKAASSATVSSALRSTARKDKAASDEEEAASEDSRAARALAWAKAHVLVVLIALAVLVALVLTGLVALFGSGGSEEAAPTSTAAASDAPGKEVQEQFSVGDKLEVTAGANQVPVTIAEFTDQGAIARDSGGQEYGLTNDQLAKWRDEHPVGEETVSSSPSATSDKPSPSKSAKPSQTKSK